MYQLLMTGYMGWTGTRGTMNRTRVFEYTADILKERFKPGGVMGTLDVAGVRGIPALFLFKGGEVVSNRMGAAPKAALKTWIDESI